MFENMTYEYLLNKTLSAVSTDVDKREGSVIYDALAPACAEMAQLYIELDNILKEGFAHTADREYLILRAEEMGIYPNTATAAVLRGVFDGEVPIGSRFNLGTLNYTVSEKIKDYEYKLTCETAGTDGNRHFGTLTPIDYVQGITQAAITELLIPGTDDEDTEKFRERYFETVRSNAFGGNREDYRLMLKSISGVGQVRVERAFNGGGNVAVYILDSDNGIPTNDFIAEVKQKLDPADHTGCGYGIVPVGHSVSVLVPETAEIDVTFDVLFSGEETTDFGDKVNAAVSDFINNANSTWEDEDVVLYGAKLLVELLRIDGVQNITSLSLNGEEYIKLTDNKVARAGSISYGREESL